MPKETFLNLSLEKKQHIEQILLEKFYNRHISQVKVSEIVEAMQMSRGAFYKYFQDLEDAYFYLIHKYAMKIHEDILTSISQHKQDFFLGIENFLRYCSELDRNDHYWQMLQLLTQSSHSQMTQRKKLSPDSPMFSQWLDLLKHNHFVMDSYDEALSFLYFIMNLVMDALTDCIVNNWNTEELVQDFRFQKKWLLQGIKQ
ncbi:TetR family transcriptional regulator [Tetragenococcus halophilus]|uniref:TetR family transcriptional regulator n=1 Tax=Tetragenococcus halophilus TaxID=51669 RepID=A0A3G5FK13_TETHA|nr:TetR family transcriptional regulator [Tetragenococcus halophilus]AYW50639.1 TetR/AcrR family transcriptional regulator [Tetragenococcus halophilus]MCF1601792.1 TetR family transcriptional regulator [Tetragenococcus halophilus]MCF1675480.1 TetR family transcriptional regulator [Tetragenococcus halophilus]MCO7025636.1 TetR family transcriptional regulator [Tetragenococcus halophilus]MCO8284706.1 TetR family transcriptional regulator [Tetragenococcus halophilus]